MPNRSHNNSGHRMMNYLNKEGLEHSSSRARVAVGETKHAVIVRDAVDLLPQIPSGSIDLIICDPPYNLDLAKWDSFTNYLDWASCWLDEIPRLLKPTGNFVLFGGLQFQDGRGGDLLELLYYLRHHSPLRLVNSIVWYYKSGMSAHRFFANRHEEIVWFSKTKKYTFNLDEVRIPFNEATLNEYLKDPRLNPEQVRKGKNPGNVWEIPRLNGNSLERVGHPTQKPLALIKRLVQALSSPGDTILDFFAGSGSTTRACVELGRHSIVSDIDPQLPSYLQKHLSKIKNSTTIHPYSLFEDN